MSFITNLNSIYRSDIQAYTEDSFRINEGYKYANKMESTQKNDNYTQEIRPLFGKNDHAKVTFGDHPDFERLRGTNETVQAYTTTMFVDIVNSTKLSLFYDLKKVYMIKNAIIRASIQIIQSFDGHVHRIMGDAVMAYFRGYSTTEFNSIINIINCTAVLRYFFENVVIKNLESDGILDESLGIRIGLDYGCEKDVLWSCYGYSGMEEVTATSYYVDIASKLQSSAGKNNIMLGESLKNEIDFPDELLSFKKIIKNYISVEDKYVTPNHKDKNGNVLNYKKYLLDWKKYLELTPIAILDPDYFGLKSACTPKIIAEIYDFGQSKKIRDYNFCGDSIKKNRAIKFSIKMSYLPRFPYSITFRIENHGHEASQSIKNGDHESTLIIKDNHDHDNIHHWDYTSYKGLHYVIINIKTQSYGLDYKRKVGIYVSD